MGLIKYNFKNLMQDGIPSFIKIYAAVGTSGDEVPFEDLKCYLAELINKYQK
ncbi:hypothetical protein [Clostridium manihotivorum]|uniref:hypothetical protein n=1 Tax=Clostridium manihotivorum TaxID=2320868 RepID=UPI0013E3FB2D|nr:hypothetical protein [Clostridium manihotivorum]